MVSNIHLSCGDKNIISSNISPISLGENILLSNIHSFSWDENPKVLIKYLPLLSDYHEIHVAWNVRLLPWLGIK